jgi:tripartite-type tricarboxylate transporter receptor subunit TctC
VPYRNIAQYTPDFIAGQVPLGFQFLPNVLGMLSSGDARALAVTSPKRMTALPDVPTAREAGSTTRPMAGSPCSDRPACRSRSVDRTAQGAGRGGERPDRAQPFIEQGAEPVSPGPEELQKFIASETAKWKAVISEGRDRADVGERASTAS